MGLFTIVFNIVQGNIVAPLVYGKAVNLHPAVVLAAIPAGGALAGIVGMFLAVPVLGVVATTWRTVLAVFGNDPPETAPAPADERPAAAAGSGPRDGPGQSPGEEAPAGRSPTGGMPAEPAAG